MRSVPARIHGPDQALAALLACPDVTRVRGTAGQVVLYAGQYPPGLFVIHAGALRVEVPGAVPASLRSRVLDAASGAFVVPAPDALEAPLPAAVSVEREAEMVFVPRSLALADPAIRRLLRQARLPAPPLTPVPDAERRG